MFIADLLRQQHLPDHPNERTWQAGRPDSDALSGVENPAELFFISFSDDCCAFLIPHERCPSIESVVIDNNARVLLSITT
ncbi:hypothetical protein IB244_01525 [Rhizobium sp. RHZ02]|uniref:hypothetical protein n=1 Tax=Rhizobium sp. RHZ02 TaxID=2769306 RepID=UPI00177AA7C7|nr:hypothetical protein [Rhizobium sp. RHZ02]MBD9450264.1 hypothetical protein [Rhizobium sp. RHZ02]